jgi:GxxExxY protein
LNRRRADNRADGLARAWIHALHHRRFEQRNGGRDRGKKKGFEDGSREIIAASIEVHRHLGPGLLESAYQHCLCRELALRGLPFERERQIPVEYKGVLLDCGYRLDLVVDGRILVEVKSVERLLPIHQAQAITYLKLAKLETALLVNFNVSAIKFGLRRLARKKISS